MNEHKCENAPDGTIVRDQFGDAYIYNEYQFGCEVYVGYVNCPYCGILLESNSPNFFNTNIEWSA